MKPPYCRPALCAVSFPLLLAAGCGGGQSGTITEVEVEECSERSTQIGTADDRAGLSAEQLVERIGQEWQGDVVWREGSADGWNEHMTILQGSVEMDAESASLVEQQKKNDEAICDREFLKVGARLHFATEDGAFDEHLSGQLVHDMATETTSWAGEPLTLDTLEGEFAPAPFAAEYDDPVLWVTLRFEPHLSGYVSVAEGAATDVMAGGFVIATVGEPPAQE